MKRLQKLELYLRKKLMASSRTAVLVFPAVRVLRGEFHMFSTWWLVIGLYNFICWSLPSTTWISEVVAAAVVFIFPCSISADLPHLVPHGTSVFQDMPRQSHGMYLRLNTYVKKHAMTYTSFCVRTNQIYIIASTEVPPYPRTYPGTICVPRVVQVLYWATNCTGIFSR